MRSLRVPVLNALLLVALLLLTSCQPAPPVTPTASPPPVAIVPLDPAGAPAEPGPDGSTGTPEAALAIPEGASLGEMGQIMRQVSGQIGGLRMGGEVPTSQLQRVMSQMSLTTHQMSQATGRSPQGTPEIRQLMAQTLEQMSRLAAQIRDEAQQMPPAERQAAAEQMQGVVDEMAAVMSELQDTSQQPTEMDWRIWLAQLGQIQGDIASMIIQFGFIAPRAPMPAFDHRL